MRQVVAFVLGTSLTAALVPGTAVAGIDQEARRPAVVAAAEHAMNGLADAAPDASFRLVSEAGHDMYDVDAAPSPGWLPERPASQARPAPSMDSIVVHRGDTLWSIAARHLSPAAPAADIDAEWHRWLATNRDVIGDDANLILPGQQLRPPPAQPGRS